MIQDEAAEADAIAVLLERLVRDARDPEAFFVRKDEAIRRLRRLAHRLRGSPKRRELTTVWKSKRAPCANAALS